MFILILLILLVLLFGASKIKDAISGCLALFLVVFILAVVLVAGNRIYERLIIFIENIGWIKFGIILITILVLIITLIKLLFTISDQNDLNNRFYYAVDKNETTKAINLLKKNPNVNLRNSMNFTLLMMAVLHENIYLVSALINSGAKLHQKNKHGETALEIAKRKGLVEIERVLVDAGAKK